MDVVTEDVDAECARILARFRAHDLGAEVTLMQLLIACEDPDRVAGVVAGEPALAALSARHAAGVRRVVDMLRSDMDSPDDAPDIDRGIAQARRLFDWSVQQSEEASVALYSLGSSELLARATAELVALFRERRWVTPERAILQIGCGIGRLEQALAPHVREAHGLDVSPGMVEAARRRCAGLANVTLAVSDGRDLRMYPDARFDLVHAIDSMPYLVQAGLALAETHVREAARVLVPGGDLVIGNFSYRDDLALDGADLRRMAAGAGLDVLGLGERPFALWDGAIFHLRKPA